MERLTNSIAAKVVSELNLEKDNKEVIAYGIFAMIQIALSIILVIIFGFIFHVVIEALIICFAGSILRKYSGGAHAGSPGNCLFIGTVICVGLAILFLYLMSLFINMETILCLGIMIFTAAYYLIYKLAPVDSAAKPIKRVEKKIRMKKGSIFVLSIYLIITMINIAAYVYLRDRRFLVYSLCLYGGTGWQVFTLTKAGHITMNRIDFFFNQIQKIMKMGGL